jgi:hypothetical protein
MLYKIDIIVIMVLVKDVLLKLNLNKYLRNIPVYLLLVQIVWMDRLIDGIYMKKDV